MLFLDRYGVRLGGVKGTLRGFRFMVTTMKLHSIDNLTRGNDDTRGEGNEMEGNPQTAKARGKLCPNHVY